MADTNERMPADYKLVDSALGRLGEAKTLSDLLKIAVAVRTTIKYESFGKESLAQNGYKPEYEKQYNYNSGVITFYYKGIMYNIPHSNIAFRILRENGFTQNNNLGVLCNGEFVDEKEYWDKLREDSDLLDAYDKVKKIRDIRSREYRKSDGEVIEDISQESKDRCYKIPENGVKVVGFAGEEGKIEPTIRINPTFIALENEDLVGTYYMNNGVVVINAPSGTYVTKSEKVIEEVSSKYDRKSSSVPFSNGERPSDPHESQLIEEAYLSDEEYERKNTDTVSKIQREIEEERYQREEKQRIELEATKRELEATRRELEELRRKTAQPPQASSGLGL